MSPFVKKIPLIVLTLLIWFPPSVLASVIKLNSGKIIEREITYRDDEMIKVDSGYGIDITYYYDEIESIDGQSPIPVEGSVESDESTKKLEPIEVIDIVREVEPVEEIVEIEVEIGSINDQSPIPDEGLVEIDLPIEEPELIEVNEIVPAVEPIEEIEEIDVEENIKILEPIVIAETIEDIEPPEEEIQIIEAEPVKDIRVIEEQIQKKESPSPFGPTIRENKVDTKSISPIVLKYIKPVSEPKIANEPQRISQPQKSMSDKIVTTVERFIEKQKNNIHKNKIRFQRKNTFIHKKLKQIPVKIRKDIFAVLSLVLICVYVITCFPIMLIANKLKRKRAWLVLIPIVQIFYFVYMAKKPLWWSVFFLVPIANIVFVLVLFIIILREMKKPYWLIIPAIVPGINIFVIWYLALSKIKLD